MVSGERTGSCLGSSDASLFGGLRILLQKFGPKMMRSQPKVVVVNTLTKTMASPTLMRKSRNIL